jgi:hypothetical protein
MNHGLHKISRFCRLTHVLYNARPASVFSRVPSSMKCCTWKNLLFFSIAVPYLYTPGIVLALLYLSHPALKMLGYCHIGVYVTKCVGLQFLF